MRMRDKIITGIGFATLVGLVIYFVRRHKATQRMLEEISEQGYETAQDILFPPKNKRSRKYQVGRVSS